MAAGHDPVAVSPDADTFDPTSTGSTPMDVMRERQLSHNAPETPTEADLLPAMNESDRDVAAGLTVPIEDVLAGLDHIAGKIDAAS